MIVTAKFKVKFNSDKWVKTINEHRETVSVEFTVQTHIEFPEICRYYLENKYGNHEIIMKGLEPVLLTVARQEYAPSKKYAFQTQVKLSGDEYKTYSRLKDNFINSYVLDKAANTDEYKKLLQECINKEGANREYHVESFVDPFVKFNNRDYKTEEYVPVYKSGICY